MAGFSSGLIGPLARVYTQVAIYRRPRRIVGQSWGSSAAPLGAVANTTRQMAGWLRGRPLVVLAAIAAIAFFSLIPGGWQERTGLPPPFEHVIAYCGTAVLMGLVRPGWRRAIWHVFFLVGLSACMEYLQNFSPGRDPRIADVMWSSSGAILGTGLVLLTSYVVKDRRGHGRN